MQATAQARNGGPAPADPFQSYLAAAELAAAFERHSARFYDFVRGQVEDDDKAARITEKAFIAACQALAAGVDRPRPERLHEPGAATAVGRACPKLGYVDDPTKRYSRATQLHRCYAGGAGTRLSAQEQNAFCLTSQFGSCPRLSAASDRRGTPDMHEAARPTVGPGARATARRQPATHIALDAQGPSTPPIGKPSRGRADKTARNVDDRREAPAAPPPDGHHPGARIVAAAHRYALLVATTVAMVAAGALLLALGAWVTTDGLPSEQDIARLTSVVPEGAKPPAAAQWATPPERVDVEALPDSAAGSRSAPDVGAVGQANGPMSPSTVGNQPTMVADPTASVRSTTAATAPVSVAAAEPAVERRTIRAPQGFANVNLRERPTTAAPSLVVLSNGTAVEVLRGTATADGFNWIQVRTSDGVAGWIVSTAVGR